jgi:hypothetical protein
MTEQELKKTWLRESIPQPGVFLDVQQIEGLYLEKAAAW